MPAHCSPALGPRLAVSRGRRGGERSTTGLSLSPDSALQSCFLHPSGTGDEGGIFCAGGRSEGGPWDQSEEGSVPGRVVQGQQNQVLQAGLSPEGQRSRPAPVPLVRWVVVPAPPGAGRGPPLPGEKRIAEEASADGVAEMEGRAGAAGDRSVLRGLRMPAGGWLRSANRAGSGAGSVQSPPRAGKPRQQQRPSAGRRAPGCPRTAGSKTSTPKPRGA